MISKFIFCLIGSLGMYKDQQSDEILDEEPVEIPIDGTLDLHTFHPGEIKDLVPAYLDECIKLGITEVRIIHGKGKGVLRRIVHAELERNPNVISYQYGRTWGDTVVFLKRTL